ncbi:MAG: prephenate dehydrogenase/arogenate dehydrogenase family protein [Firmicutes bacterium HGW-Firmicutes-15]|nr:MAG: prephenate dehydrogenase/arogenate dehydrogenase family protein [Firmicutes bacterium HGW-Firmicutes-15]
MKRIAIIGLGVIGASLGMALQSARPDLEVLGTDIDPATMQKAMEMAAISRPLLNEDISACDVVFIATPLRIIPQILMQISEELSPGTIVSDVGSVKSWVMKQYEKYLPPGVSAIGGHPLAGSDRSGITGADKYLLQNAIYVLTPLATTASEKIESLKDLLAETGARVVILSPDEHDKMVSKVSHLPHIVAASLMNKLEQHQGALRLAAGGLRDTTRIAASNPELWEDILLLNGIAVVEEIRDLISQLNLYQQAIENNDRTSLCQYLATAQRMRKNMPLSRSSLEYSADIVAIIPDKPGIIGVLGTLLGEAGININDIQIMGVRDENEGSIRMGVPQSQVQVALQLLRDKGIRAWIRD